MQDSDMNCDLPLLNSSYEAATIAFYNGRSIQKKTFLYHVEQARRILQKHKCCINLCEDRYHFLVVFTACASLDQVSLLPSSRADKEIERLQESYKDNYIVDNRYVEEICQKDDDGSASIIDDLRIEKNQVVAIVFTSGSTGIPKANHKTWGQLFESAIRIKERFFSEEKQYSVIATVPPQHMFGFETTIVYPLILGVAIHAGRPFYPLDIKKALTEMSSPHILVTTPLHLKACISDEDEWPGIDFIISATAEMDEHVAIEAEKMLNTQVFEIYGCSEAGAIATRRMTDNAGWKLLKDYKVTCANERTLLNAPGYKASIVIPDQLEVYDDKYFRLVGRNHDVINIGGKRGSLADLTIKLKGIDDVSDAIIFMPDEIKSKRVRLAALVVSDSSIKDLRQELIKFVDAVFIPRPIIIVRQLPYNELGKLPRVKLLEILNQYMDKSAIQESA